MVDKQQLYGKYEEGEDRRHKARERQRTFAERVAHKAHDMAMDEDKDDVKVTTTKTGIGAGGAIGIAALGALPSLGAIGALAWALFKDQPSVPNPTPTPGPAVAPIRQEAEFDVRHYNHEGNLIPIERLPEELRKR